MKNTTAIIITAAIIGCASVVGVAIHSEYNRFGLFTTSEPSVSFRLDKKTGDVCLFMYKSGKLRLNRVIENDTARTSENSTTKDIIWDDEK